MKPYLKLASCTQVSFKRWALKLNFRAIPRQENLIGAEVYATDLRGGAALVLAGLAAEGETIIYNVEHLKRGYENMVEKLTLIGAQIDERAAEVTKEDI